MTQLRKYVVREEREVMVEAHDPINAVMAGNIAFDVKTTDVDYGNIVSPVRIIETSAREEY